MGTRAGTLREQVELVTQEGEAELVGIGSGSGRMEANHLRAYPAAQYDKSMVSRRINRRPLK